ncbi:MAG TPA: SEC-C metal-binding domain-containing protein [Vicinamibacterales bacterium]|nr:SEC-C metal-binding domain-containing protein [Vicinamibacterales bacterium]
MAKTGRNDACPCGSGRKFKQCCERKPSSSSSRLIVIAIGALIVAAILATVSNSKSGSPQQNRVWSAEHGHYHDASGREIPR